jgi:hypothetical protein
VRLSRRKGLDEKLQARNKKRKGFLEEIPRTKTPQNSLQKRTQICIVMSKVMTYSSTGATISKHNWKCMMRLAASFSCGVKNCDKKFDRRTDWERHKNVHKVQRNRCDIAVGLLQEKSL